MKSKELKAMEKVELSLFRRIRKVMLDAKIFDGTLRFADAENSIKVYTEKGETYIHLKDTDKEIERKIRNIL